MDHLDHEHEYSNGRRKVIKQTEEETGPIETIANTYGKTGLAEADPIARTEIPNAKGKAREAILAISKTDGRTWKVKLGELTDM